MNILLLHGYLESGRIWDPFKPFLEKDFQVFAPDLPGHGKAPVAGPVHTMEIMAAAVFDLINKKGLGGFHLVGHSMGGYVALAFLEMFPEKVKSLTLLHSTCFADTDEKKKNRDREIALVKEGKKDLIVQTNIPMAFATERIEANMEYVEFAKETALRISDEGVLLVLEGMKRRPDRSHLLKNPGRPIQLIAGRKDNYIPFEVMEKMASFHPELRLSVLEDSGHMGFLEEKDQCAKLIRAWIREKGR